MDHPKKKGICRKNVSKEIQVNQGRKGRHSSQHPRVLKFSGGLFLHIKTFTERERFKLEQFCDDAEIRILKKVRFTKEMVVYRLELKTASEYSNVCQIAGKENVSAADNSFACLDKTDQTPAGITICLQKELERESQKTGSKNPF